MIQKIISIIDSCKTSEQLTTCRRWLILVSEFITTTDIDSALGAIKLKEKQLSDNGWTKITGENRFPVDDEHIEKH